MAASEDVITECENKHEILADFIKSVHGNLRRSVRKGWSMFVVKCYFLPNLNDPQNTVCMMYV